MSSPPENISVVEWLPGNQLRFTVMERIIMLVGVVVIFVSCFLAPRFLKFDLASASGAMLLLAGVIVEYHHNKFEKIALNKSFQFSAGVGSEVIFDFCGHRKAMKYLSHLCVIIGTLIWAYGGILFP